MTFTNLPHFIEYIDLNALVSCEDDMSTLWSFLIHSSTDKDSISLEIAQAAIKELVCTHNTEDPEQHFRDSFQSIRLSYPKANKTQTDHNLSSYQLVEIKKLFSLLDFRKQPNVFVTQLYELLKENKYIKVTQRTLDEFLTSMCDDSTEAQLVINGAQAFSFEMLQKALAANEHRHSGFDEVNFEHSDQGNYYKSEVIETVEDDLESNENTITYLVKMLGSLQQIMFTDLKQEVTADEVKLYFDKVKVISEAARQLMSRSVQTKSKIGLIKGYINTIENEKDNLIEEIEANCPEKQSDDILSIKELLLEAETKAANLKTALEAKEKRIQGLEKKLVELREDNYNLSEKAFKIEAEKTLEKDIIIKLKAENKLLMERVDHLTSNSNKKLEKLVTLHDNLSVPVDLNSTLTARVKSFKINSTELLAMRHDSLVDYTLLLETEVRQKEKEIEIYKAEFLEKEQQIKNLQLGILEQVEEDLEEKQSDVNISKSSVFTRLSKLKRAATVDMKQPTMDILENKEGVTLFEMDLDEPEETKMHKVSKIREIKREIKTHPSRINCKTIHLDFDMIDEEEEFPPIQSKHSKQLSKVTFETSKEPVVKKQPTFHSRRKTKLIEELQSKEKESRSFDFLTLRNNEKMLKSLEDMEEISAKDELFSDNIFVIDSTNTKKKLFLVITKKYIYLLKPGDLFCEKKVSVTFLNKLTLSAKIINLVVIS